MKRWVAGLSTLGAIGFGYSGAQIKDIVNPAIKPVGLEAQDSHAAASLLGQFRTSASSWLFLHADLYLHNGVEMRPMTDLELKGGKQSQEGTKSEEKIQNEANIVTVVPSAKDDFRGIFGNVERTTSSFKDMAGHSHNEPTTSLPLYRLMTVLDPQFVQGWTTGGYIMLWDKKPGAFEKTVAFLKDGLENNPKSIDILTQLAYCYLKGYTGSRDFKNALPFLEGARKVGVQHWDHLTEEEREAVLMNYRRLAVSARELGKKDLEIQTLAEGLKYFEADPPMVRLWGEAHGKQIDQTIIDPPSILIPAENLSPKQSAEQRDHNYTKHTNENS